MLIPDLTTYSGMTVEQFDDLLTPSDSDCLSEIMLFFRRLVYGLLHCEWITDAKLVDKLYTHVKANGISNASVESIYQAFRERIIDVQAKPEVQTQLNELQQFLPININKFKTPFTAKMWDLTMPIERLVLHFDSHEQFTVFFADVDNILDENLRILEVMTFQNKEEHLAKLKNCKATFHDYHQKSIHGPRLILPFDELSELKAAVIQIEEDMGIYNHFRQLLNDMLNGIMKEDPQWQQLYPEAKNCPTLSPEQLADKIRICRKFILERTYAVKDETGGGEHRQVFRYLKSILYPNSPIEINNYPDGPLEHVNGSLLRKHPQEDVHTVLAFIENPGYHFLPYVYAEENGKPYFMKLDNLRAPKEKIAVDEMSKRRERSGSIFNALECKDSVPMPFTPMPETWILPKWERNNCFMSAALIELALVHFYHHAGLKK